MNSRLAGEIIASLAAEDAGGNWITSSAPLVVQAAAKLAAEPGTTILMVVGREEEADRNWREALALGLPAFMIPAWDTLPFERVMPSSNGIGTRQRAIWRLRKGLPGLYIAPLRSALMRLSGRVLSFEPLRIKLGESYDMAAIEDLLTSFGYLRVFEVGAQGEFAVRGSILDCFPVGDPSPFRADFFGNEVDRLTIFDPTSQVSVDDVGEVEVFPAREVLLDNETRELLEDRVREHPDLSGRLDAVLAGIDPLEGLYPLLLDAGSPILSDLLQPSALLVCDSKSELAITEARLLTDERAVADAIAPTWGMDPESMPEVTAPLSRLLASRAEVEVADPEGAELLRINADPADFPSFAGEIRSLFKAGYRIIVTAHVEERLKALRRGLEDFELLASFRSAEDALPERGIWLVPSLPFTTSFADRASRIAVITVGHQTPASRDRDRSQTGTESRILFDALKEGSHVVHETHGVAIYKGLVKRSLAGIERDYIHLAFAEGDNLYLPFDQIGKITPYVGSEKPTLTRLGKGEWQRRVTKARHAASEVAQELVVLYQKRKMIPGKAMARDSTWQREVEDAFPYELTPDQARAVEEVKLDQESDQPMDRVICADVGFGKTEVALRAAFKAIQSGYQVAVITPTTLLAQQHFNTFTERFEGFPIKVGMLSRFVPAREAKAVARGLETGELDLVVATHSLLSKQIKFKALGLLVVDEEQRFGVKHKELIKQRYTDVDVLTLSATPIPRTLEMALVGIKDISLIRTPPRERQPILTHVGPYDRAAISEAIRRELVRGGQVFYVHNRIKDIETVAAKIRDLVPGARVLVAHGAKADAELERVVEEFWHRKADVLVCTTIIENGIDLPTVNTLIVDDAHRLGLAQLHQLRGRVGRSRLRAYAYLFFPRHVPIGKIAAERLRTVVENTDLGSGYRIAMRDLELRGAGTLLGERQSGHAASVGYELYVKLVSEAISSLRGEEVEPEPEISLDLPVSCSIPSSYVGDEAARMDIYHRLSKAVSAEEVSSLDSEVRDRFGKPPEQVGNLFRLASLRVLLLGAGVERVATRRGSRSGWIELSVEPVELKASMQVRASRMSGITVRGKTITVAVAPSEDVIGKLEQALNNLGVIERS